MREADAAAVATARATVIRPDPFEDEPAASRWLDGLRRDDAELAGELGGAVRELNIAIRAHRASAEDPYARDVSAEGAHAARVGYGLGDEVAEGRYGSAWELPQPLTTPARRRAQRLAPQERLAAVLSGRVDLLAGEELVLRARSDVAAGRTREAALQTRIALEALAAELGEMGGGLGAHRAAVSEAAASALRGDPPEELASAVVEAVESLEAALRRHRMSE